MSAPTRLGLLANLDDPSGDRGIHFLRPSGEWTRTSYEEIVGHATRIAGHLVAEGARPGDTVNLLLGAPDAFVPAFLACLLAGIAPSPIASPVGLHSAAQYRDHVTGILRAARPRLVLTDEALLETAAEAVTAAGAGRPVLLPGQDQLPTGPAPRGRAEDTALLQFTSGSSGLPKGVRVSLENLESNVAAILSWLGITPEDSCSSWLPLYHDMGLVGAFLGSFASGIDFWLMSPADFIGSPLRWLECHGRSGVTVTTAPNFGYAYATRRVRPEQLEGMDFSSWRVAMSGAERVVPAVLHDFAERLRPHGFRPQAFTPCYGLAEATLAVTGVAPGEQPQAVRLDGPLVSGEQVPVAETALLGDPAVADAPEAGWLTSCGAPVPGTAVLVVGEDGEALPEGAFGEIAVVGPAVAQGYQGSREVATAEFDDGRLRTGDSGFLHDGELYVVGRIGDSVKVRGRAVHAEDVEAALLAVPGMPAGRFAAALGGSGETAQAVVVVESPGDVWLAPALATLRSQLDTTVQVTVVRTRRGAIPRTSSGKPRRRQIWLRWSGGDLAGEVLHGTAPSPVPTS